MGPQSDDDLSGITKRAKPLIPMTGGAYLKQWL